MPLPQPSPGRVLPRPAWDRGQGRKAFAPTDADRRIVRLLRAAGVPPAEIARELGVAERTMRKHLATEMADGRAAIVARIGAQVVRKALAGDNQMMIFYLKNHGGDAWRDKLRHEYAGPDGESLEPPDLVISFLPARS